MHDTDKDTSYSTDTESSSVSEESSKKRARESKATNAGSPSVSKQESDWMATYLTDDWMREVYSRITDDSWKAHCLTLSQPHRIQSFLKTVELKIEAEHGLG